MLPLIDRFKACYQNFSDSSLLELSSVYSPEAVFIDPIHKVLGLSNIEAYFRDMCTNLVSCQFTYHHQAMQGNDVFIQWTMLYQHKRLAGGAVISVPGVTRLLVRDDRVVEHEDFYDMGAMVYEKIPLLGRVISWLRMRLATSGPQNSSDELGQSL